MSAVLVVSGAVVCLLSCLAHLALEDPYDALHAIAPVSALGAPLVLVGIAVHDGTPHGVAKLLLTAVVLIVSGPVASVAMARAGLARDGVLEEEER